MPPTPSLPWLYWRPAARQRGGRGQALGLLGGVLLTLIAPVSPVWAQSIYTCIDAQGRRITADRPIAACNDREQHELNPSGTIKRVIPPSLTAQERARLEAQRQAEALRQAQIEDERRKARLLLQRYPDEASHQKARQEALAQVERVIEAVNGRVAQLNVQRREIEAELEFYQRDPSKAPAWLKRRQEDNAQQRASQAIYLADQEREKLRIQQLFNEELDVLRGLWAPQAGR